MYIHKSVEHIKKNMANYSHMCMLSAGHTPYLVNPVLKSFENTDYGVIVSFEDETSKHDVYVLYSSSTNYLNYSKRQG